MEQCGSRHLPQAQPLSRAPCAQVFVEYVVLAGVNDQPEHAQQLADLLQVRSAPQQLASPLVCMHALSRALPPAGAQRHPEPDPLEPHLQPVHRLLSAGPLGYHGPVAAAQGQGRPRDHSAGEGRRHLWHALLPCAGRLAPGHAR